MRRLFLAVVMAAVSQAAAPVPQVCDVTAYGARGDGRTNDAAAIQRAIDDCARRGGTVLFSAGDYLSGTIVLKSNVTLRLSPGATLWGSRQISDYNPLHLIYAKDAENIAIEGEGAIDGNGDAFWDKDFRPKDKRPSPLIELVACRNVRIRDIRIRNTPGWGIHPLDCDGVFIRGISMITDMRGPNTDGIDPDSSRNVIISDCYIQSGDDAIVLKSRPGPPPRPCENVTVTNCVLASDDSAIKIGTASYGDFRNCTFSNCVIYGTRYGIGLYVKDGATVEGVSFSNITIDTSVDLFNQTTGSKRGWIEYPIFIDLEKRSVDSRTGRIRDVSFSDIRIRTKGRILAAGMPAQPLENLTFRNIAMRVTGFEAVESQRKPRGVARMPPAPRDMDYASVPAAMIFANIRGLILDSVRVIWDSAGTQDRHAIYAGRVEDLYINGFSGGPAGKNLAAIGLERVRRVLILGARAKGAMPSLAGLSGTPESEISLHGNDLKGAARALQTGAAYVHLPD